MPLCVVFMAVPSLHGPAPTPTPARPGLPRTHIEHAHGACVCIRPAGSVVYDTSNFLEKNKDYVVAEHQALLGRSGHGLVAAMFAPEQLQVGARVVRVPARGGRAALERRAGQAGGKGAREFARHPGSRVHRVTTRAECMRPGAWGWTPMQDVRGQGRSPMLQRKCVCPCVTPGASPPTPPLVQGDGAAAAPAGTPLNSASSRLNASGGGNAPPQGGSSGGAKSQFQFRSVGLQCRRQLAELMAALSQLQPHYVRCIKPNASSLPGAFDAPYSLQQLKCGGVMEAVRISCAGVGLIAWAFM